MAELLDSRVEGASLQPEVNLRLLPYGRPALLAWIADGRQLAECIPVVRSWNENCEKVPR
jgi:hypothetical protein